MRRRRPKLPPSISTQRGMQRFLLGLVITAIASVLGYDQWQRQSQPLPKGNDHARYHDRTFRVSRVIDGDTLDLSVPDNEKATTRVRLWGVDTPEIAHGGQKNMVFGPEAKQFAERTLEGREVYVALVPDSTRDRHGRLLAFVYLERGGAMFNQMLLDEGYAYADPRFDHPWKNDFLDAEKRAKRNKVGLWDRVSRDDMPKWRQKRD